jgi:hypothetical protein
MDVGIHSYKLEVKVNRESCHWVIKQTAKYVGHHNKKHCEEKRRDKTLENEERLLIRRGKTIIDHE